MKAIWILLIMAICSIPAIENASAPKDKTKCGVSKLPAMERSNIRTTYRKTEFPQARVAGGTEAMPHSWPFMVALYLDYNFYCGASLIDELHVLTAAHCVVDRKTSEIFSADRLHVILGAHNRYIGETYAINKVAVHPKFINGDSFPNDIAVLRLDRPANLSSPNIGTVGMPSFYLTAAGGRECVVIGWGKTSETGVSSVNLQEVKVPIIDNGVCNSREYYGGLIGPSMLCAGMDDGSKDTCLGDSGGPLVCKVNGQWQIHGVVSWGYGCGRPYKPGVYARVSVLQSWINSQVSALNRAAEEDEKNYLVDQLTSSSAFLQNSFILVIFSTVIILFYIAFKVMQKLVNNQT